MMKHEECVDLIKKIEGRLASANSEALRTVFESIFKIEGYDPSDVNAKMYAVQDEFIPMETNSLSFLSNLSDDDLLIYAQCIRDAAIYFAADRE